jgi:hypothetical protein
LRSIEESVGATRRLGLMDWIAIIFVLALMLRVAAAVL